MHAISFPSASGYADHEVAAQQGMMAALDLLNQPGFLVDALQQVLCMNEGASALIGDGLLVSQRRLRASARCADAPLQVMLTQACRPGWGQPADSVALPRPGGRPLIVQAAPIRSHPGEAQARALVVVNRLDFPPDDAVTRMAQACGLTVAERNVARELAAGGGITGCAEALGVSASTARTHLKAIFAKTDTHSQAELTALISGAGPSLAAPAGGGLAPRFLAFPARREASAQRRL